MRGVSWLNLHQWGVPRDVRRLIYAQLEKCDRQVVELAHGVRKKMDFECVLQIIRKEYVHLVHYVYHMDMGLSWVWDEVGNVVSSFENDEIVCWYAETVGGSIRTWGVQPAIMTRCIVMGRDKLFKWLSVTWKWWIPLDAFILLAKYDNLPLAQWLHMRTDVSHYTEKRFEVLMEHLIGNASLEFYLWAITHLQIPDIIKQRYQRAAESRWFQSKELQSEKRIKL